LVINELLMTGTAEILLANAWPRYNQQPIPAVTKVASFMLESYHAMQDEMALLAGVRTLDPQALTQVHDAYYPAIFRYIAFRVGNQETAEDLASEVFTRLLSAVRDQSAPQNTLRGWLYGVASRVVADYYRRQYRAEGTDMKNLLSTAEPADPADSVIHGQTIEELHEALGELTEDQQNVIALRFGYEMSIRDVAKTMGKSEGAVKQLQARAVAALSRKLSVQGVQ
jgi:RNA polymerase sigma-70 factor (ECF subfamily)